VHFVDFIITIYHDARSSECQSFTSTFTMSVKTTAWIYVGMSVTCSKERRCQNLNASAKTLRCVVVPTSDRVKFFNYYPNLLQGISARGYQ
jgi:hypothetical protein